MKGVVKNLIFSFCAYALPTAVLQFIIQPIIAKSLGSELNGQYLTLMSLNYFMVGITATVLCTVRMLQNEEYTKANIIGDFNIFFSVYAIIMIVVMPLGYIAYTKSFDILNIVLYLIVGLLYLYHDYIFAQYRLELNYKKILINNIILVIGYFIGLCLFYIFHIWQLVIISAYLLGGIYDYFNTNFIKEPLKKTELFSVTFKKILVLTGSHSISSTTTYFDKLLLYPVLGGTSVSIYNTATIVGKMLILVSAPLSSVLLSYLVKIKSLNFRLTPKHIVCIIASLAGAYGICVLIGFPLSNFLYPDWAEQSHIYIPITVAASIMLLVSNLLNTVLIRFYKITYQVLLQGINLIVYVVTSCICLHFWSLMGFCIGNIISNFIKMMLMFIIIYKSKKKIKGD